MYSFRQVTKSISKGLTTLIYNFSDLFLNIPLQFRLFDNNSLFYSEKEQKLRETKTKLILNGALKVRKKKQKRK